MALRGQLAPNHVPVNQFTLTVTGTGGGTFFFTELSGIETELQSIDLPDRTKASGGNVLPQEFTGKTPLHHAATRAAMESWFKEGQCPVTAGYKKSATLIHKAIDGTVQGKYTISGMWIMKRKLPDLDTTNDGEMAVIEWSFSSDAVTELIAKATTT